MADKYENVSKSPDRKCSFGDIIKQGDLNYLIICAKFNAKEIMVIKFSKIIYQKWGSNPRGHTSIGT